MPDQIEREANAEQGPGRPVDLVAVRFLASGQDDPHSVALLECVAEIERLTAALKKANSQAEYFERGWYLRGDVLERLQQWADAYPLAVFPEPLRQEWQQANEVLAQAGLSMTRMSASNMRHVINGVRQLVDEGLKA